MNDLLPPSPLFSAFLLTSLVLALTPGPGVLFIVTRSLVQGRISGLVSVAGITLGNLGNALAAALGLAAFHPRPMPRHALVRIAQRWTRFKSPEATVQRRQVTGETLVFTSF